jgi:hypothetical protein
MPATKDALDYARRMSRDDAFVDDSEVAPINRGVARTILRERGWTIERPPTRMSRRRAVPAHPVAVKYVAPDGGFCWHLGEAIWQALTAEAFDADPSGADRA